jgi:hypothetical protein
MAAREGANGVARLANGLWCRAGATAWSLSGLRFKSAMPQPTPAVDLNDLHRHPEERKVLHPHMLNENVTKTQYAVRGELYLRAEQLRKEGKEIIFTNGATAISSPQTRPSRPRLLYGGSRGRSRLVRALLTSWLPSPRSRQPPCPRRQAAHVPAPGLSASQHEYHPSLLWVVLNRLRCLCAGAGAVRRPLPA